MKKNTGLLIISLVLLGAIFASAIIVKPQSNKKPQLTPTQAKVLAENSKFNYTGKDGVNALTLLKQNSEIKQNDSGLVISINGREALSSKREYWSFYINGKMAQVGPADYVTKNTDKIEWKIETY